ncbi:MAG TPA: hypothetical protein VMV29_24615, partial [Ktedonobacterales bacterium]|nr:hypothetical protein [Ktedonobacterales bacterium]
KQRKSGGGFWAGIILGIAIGATVALILAPARPDEAAKLDELEAGQSRQPEIIGKLRARYSDALELGREAYRQARGEVIANYNRAKADQ